MNLYKGVSKLFQTAASANTLMLVSNINERVTYDDTKEFQRLQSQRDARRREAQERIASLKKLDVNRLPLVATDRNVIERALHEPEISAFQPKSATRSNGGIMQTVDRDHVLNGIVAVSGVHC